MKFKDRIFLGLLLVLFASGICWAGRYILRSGDIVYFDTITRLGVDSMAGDGLSGGDTTLWADFGSTSGKVCQGNDSRLPTTDEKAAMTGANSPSASNAFATMSDTSSADTGVQTITDGDFLTNSGDAKNPILDVDVDDTSEANTQLWTAEKITSELADKLDIADTDSWDIASDKVMADSLIWADKYTQAEADALLLDKADTPHDHNNLYYTESESDTLLLAKADTPHAHDDRYYTESESDSLLDAKADTPHNHDDRYYTETEVGTWRNSTTQTEMGYVHGVTSDIQTQFNDLSAQDSAVWGNITGTLSNQTDLQTALDDKVALADSDIHTHTESDITDLDKYSQSEIDTFLSDKVALADSDLHTHTESDITDLDKYSQSAVDNLLSDKVDLADSAIHTHTESDITDLDKYTQAEVDAKITDIDTAKYDSTLVYTKSELNAGQLDNLYYTESEIDTKVTDLDTAKYDSPTVDTLLDAKLAIADSPVISDVAYNATSWNSNADAASKNAIRDKVETMNTAIGLNTAKETNTDDQTIDVFSISGDNVQLSLERDGEATKTVDISGTTAVAANTAKNTNVSTALSEGTRDDTTYHINSDGSSPDIILPQANTNEAGLLSGTKFDEIVANTAAKHTQGTDQKLDNGGANELTAAETRTHLDNVTKHRLIDDTSIANTELWSADKITTQLSGKQASGNYLEDSEFASAGLMKTDGAAGYSIVTDNSANWQTAYGWGDHSDQNYFDTDIHTLDDIPDGSTYKLSHNDFSDAYKAELDAAVADSYLDSGQKADIDLNTTHRSSDGSDHNFIDQDVTSASNPTFAGLKIESECFIKEQAAADSDQAGYGQIWTKNTTPNEIWFTDDAGTDQKLSNTKFVFLSSSNKLISGSSMNIGASGFVAKISGNPTATSVVYDTDTNEQSLGFVAYANKIGKLVLHNLTRGNSRLCTDISTATNTITTDSSTDDWADNDDITAVSQTVIWVTSNWYELDCSSYLPINAIGFIGDATFFDSADAGGQLFIHPYETYANQKINTTRNAVANLSIMKTIIIPVINQKIVFSVLTTTGGDTGRVGINVTGYITEN